MGDLVDPDPTLARKAIDSGFDVCTASRAGIASKWQGLPTSCLAHGTCATLGPRTRHLNCLLFADPKSHNGSAHAEANLVAGGPVSQSTATPPITCNSAFADGLGRPTAIVDHVVPAESGFDSTLGSVVRFISGPNLI